MPPALPPRPQGYPVALLILGATILADGFDTQIFALAVPAIMKDWGMERSVFAPALTLGLLFAALGTTLGGVLGDRLGRRPVLIGAVVLFALATAGLAAAQDAATLSILRSLSGLGLGAAMPNASTLIAELSPERRRSLAITLGAACIPLGGALAGLAAGQILPRAGWPALFLIGGGAGLLIAAALALKVPESPALLSAKASRDPRTAPSGGDGVLGQARRRDTLGFWGAAIFSMFGIYSLLSWLPAILGEAGHSLAFVGGAMGVVNLGGLGAGLSCGFAIARFGSRPVVVALAVTGAAACAATALAGLASPGRSGLLLALLAVQGACVGGMTVALYPLGVQIYPSIMRARGIGWGIGVGRAAAVASPLLAGAILSGFGAAGFFCAVAAAMILCLVSLLAIRNHAPPARRMAERAIESRPALSS